MEFIDYSSSLYSLLPALLALGLAVVTHRVLLSLGIGILSGALLLTDFSVFPTFTYLFDLTSGLVWQDGELVTGKLNIIMFLIFLGMMTAILTLSGGAAAFANWAQLKVKNKRGSTLLTACLGIFIFVDDYFNSLTVGTICRPVTDRFQVSRAKLAYIIDSTAAPMCVLMPASSWGAYIITVIGGILMTHQITDYSPLTAFAYMIPMNFYAVFALLLVFAVVWFQFDIGAMHKYELEARQMASNDPDLTDNQESDELGIEESKNGCVADLVIPIVVLITATISFMIYSGYQSLVESGQAFSILGSFENTNVGSSLLYGSAMGLLSSLFTVLRQKIETPVISHTLMIGAKSMLGAVCILFFAWSIGAVIEDMQTGAYLSQQIQGNLSVEWLPVILFLLSGLMAFSTGTSWGTFGIMLPIAGDLAAASEIALMLPMLSAVLAGAVFGDHCSPISDTTILSATGARCDHIVHVSTQLPYALTGAAIASVSFAMLGFTQSILISFGVGLFVFCCFCGFFAWSSKRALPASA